MQDNQSKLNTALLVILIILVGVGIWMLSNLRPGGHDDYERNTFTSNGANTVPNSNPLATSAPNQEATTYTYKNHGFTVELPIGYTPHEEQSEGGPAISITLPNSQLSYVTNVAFWEQSILPEYHYAKNEKIGSTEFKVYEYGDGYTTTNFYWFKQGNVGYQFSGDTNLLKTFKFVGWAQ